jgi:O-antigen/teichoic acid export membrane protein
MQNDIEQVKKTFLNIVNMTVSLNAPILLSMFAFSSEIVNFFLGSAWSGAVEFLQLFALWGLFRSIRHPVGSLLFGKGRTDIAFLWNLITAIALAGVLFVVVERGPKTVAVSLVCVEGVLLLFAWMFLIRPVCKVQLSEYVTTVFVPIAIASMSVIMGYTINILINKEIIGFTAAILTTFFCYYFISTIYNKSFIAMLHDSLAPKRLKNFE